MLVEADKTGQNCILKKVPPKMSKKYLSTTHRFQNSAEQLLSHVFIQTGQCHMIIN